MHRSAVNQEVRQTVIGMLNTVPEVRDQAARYQDLAKEMAQHPSG